MARKLHPITISNISFGDLNKTTIYLTADLFQSLEDEKTESALSLLELLKQGRLVQALKHLLEHLRSVEPNAILVLTEGETGKEGNKYYINYEGYRRAGRSTFLNLRRETGLEVSGSFLHAHFPGDFSSTQLKSSQIKQVEDDLPNVIGQLTKKTKNQIAVIDESTEIIRKLTEEKKQIRKNKRLLKQEIDHLEDLRRQSNIAFYQEKIDELRYRLTKDFSETTGPNSWVSSQ
jgi:hypothetical protein